MRITLAAPAKVNLRLRVGPRGPSGYHAVDTLLASLQLADTITLSTVAGASTLELAFGRPLTRTPDMGPAEENLAVRAARAFFERAGTGVGVKIRLVKRIPAGAGLGGGSSDAAAVLRGLGRLLPGVLTAGELMEIGAALGSDVPFFVTGALLAHGAGRGEKITALSALPERFLVVAIPPFTVGTADAYGWLDEDRPTAATPDPVRVLAEPDWETVAAGAVNDFEGPVFRRHPELEAIRNALQGAGARPALLAGSGSTVFGVFEDRDEARAAAAVVEESGSDTLALVTRTRAR
jgi:4-diphosphocytidyl-2-C-methyl-D-erythritol kinase